MSTMREQFEAWQSKQGRALRLAKEDSSEYCSSDVQSDWESWQAATEAAKATGTAGEPRSIEELIKLPPCDVIAYSCIGENDAYSPRATIAYGRACAEAARQPAPVDAKYSAALKIVEAVRRDGDAAFAHLLQDFDAATNRSQP